MHNTSRATLNYIRVNVFTTYCFVEMYMGVYISTITVNSIDG